MDAIHDDRIAAGAANRSSLIHRYLDPATSLTEVLCGLITTLTFTLGAGIVIEDEGREGTRQLLIAVLGCNIAWGIIDGFLVFVARVFDRGRLHRLGQNVRRAADEHTGVALVAAELDEVLERVTDAAERKTLYARLVTNLRSTEPQPNPVLKSDWLGAITSFWLVVLATAPAALPFLLIDNLFLALRVSNAILLALLFVTGFVWARQTTGSPWRMGFGMLLAGLVLVIVAIPLGG
jgi:hypothetical protein